MPLKPTHTAGDFTRLSEVVFSSSSLVRNLAEVHTVPRKLHRFQPPWFTIPAAADRHCAE